MEHHINPQVANLVPPGGNNLSVIQLEGGDEECQIKRIVFSGATTGAHVSFQIGLFQDVPVAADFASNNGSAVFYAAVGAQQVLINETTTIRVPRDWYIGILGTNLGVVATDISIFTQLNYKVLS